LRVRAARRGAPAWRLARPRSAWAVAPRASARAPRGAPAARARSRRGAPRSGAPADQLAHPARGAGRVEAERVLLRVGIAVLDQDVGHREAARWAGVADLGKQLEHGAAEAAHARVLLDRHDRAAAPRECADALAVERLREARIQDR